MTTTDALCCTPGASGHHGRMWKRRPALKLFVVDHSAPRRRSRLRRILTLDWFAGRTSPVRATTRERSETSPHERRTPDSVEIEQDSAAFVETLGAPMSGTAYRLHSVNHYVSCSSGEYEHLSSVQRTTPVRVKVKDGRFWWWYRDRFWWVDGRLRAREVESAILSLDLASHDQREAFERAQADLVGRNGAAPTDEAVPDHVRREVWFRDRGRCTDCGVASSLAFDHVLPLAAGGSNTALNLELRCRPCQQRRRDNEGSATVGKARIGARAAKQWGMEVKDISWPRDS